MHTRKSPCAATTLARVDREGTASMNWFSGQPERSTVAREDNTPGSPVSESDGEPKERTMERSIQLLRSHCLAHLCRAASALHPSPSYQRRASSLRPPLPPSASSTRPAPRCPPHSPLIPTCSPTQGNRSTSPATSSTFPSPSRRQSPRRHIPPRLPRPSAPVAAARGRGNRRHRCRGKPGFSMCERQGVCDRRRGG